MKRLAILAATAASVLAAPAVAAPYVFTFSSANGSGSGTLTTSGTGDQQTVTDITGTVDGSAITGLSSFAVADQQLFFNLPSFFDTNGVSFSTANGTLYNFTNYPDNTNRIVSSLLDPGGTGSPTPAPLTISITAAPTGTSVPEPATWGMMVLGFGLVGAGLRSRKVRTSVRFA